MGSLSYTRQARSSRPGFTINDLWVGLAAGGLLFVAVAVAVFGFSRLAYAGRVLPGVSVAGVDVGGKTPAEAAELITAQFSFPQKGRILLVDQSPIAANQTNTWLMSPAELGLYLDPEASAAAAYQIGRAGSPFARAGQQFAAWYYGQNVAPNLIFDGRAARAALEKIAQGVNRPVVEASLSLNGAEVAANPGQIGRAVDISATLGLISTQARSLRDGAVNLVIQETAPEILDASAQADLARKILSEPFTLTLPEGESGAGPWSIAPTDLAKMLAVQRVEGSFQVGIHEALFGAYVSSLAPDLLRSPANAKFIFNDETRQLDVLQASVRGRSLDVTASLQAIQEKLLNSEHNAALVFTYSDPPVTDQATAEQLGVTELVHAETSYFYGSSTSRVQNIITAASKFHGVLVAPGETFSMASALGDITLDNGYAEALIILGGQTIKGVGGGVCQVSTTLFRGVFFAGYPIVERHAHAYRVYYYEKVAGNRINANFAGLDATVFVPLVDFKFTNDTPYWLLMETYVDAASSSITWKFYSTPDGRSVDWTTTGPTNITEPPDTVYRENPDLPQGEIKQVDWAAQGADVTVDRVVTRNGQEYIRDRYYTHYEPWSDVFEYGPGTELPNPDEEGGGEGESH